MKSYHCHCRATFASAGTQPIVVTSSVVHHAAHSECLGFAFSFAFLCLYTTWRHRCVLLPLAGRRPDARTGAHHVHPAHLHDGAPDAAAQPPLHGQQWDSQ